MSPGPEKGDSFDDVFEANLGKNIIVYTTNGQAMKGILRAYDPTSIRMDNVKGKEGGTAVKRSIITTATAA